MTCADALERMLEADPSVLTGGDSADPALTAHLRECGRCRAVAAALAAELVELDEGIGAMAEHLTPGTDIGPRPVDVPAMRRSLRTRRWGWKPVAAAAALAGVLVLGRGGSREPGEPMTPVVDEPRVVVTLPADRGAAVMATTNPRITVVWLYERSEQ